MRRFTLVFDLQTDAFADDPQMEISRLLRTTAASVERYGSVGGPGEHKVRDSNGNTVGEWSIRKVRKPLL